MRAHERDNPRIARGNASMEQIHCALCGVDDASLYAEENGYRAVRCRRCGLVYVNPRPDIREMKRLYDGQETQIDIAAHLTRRDVKCAQARWCLRTIRRYQASGKLLEVGCAAGYLLWEAQKLGYQVQGIDLTHAFVEFARTQLGVPVHEGTLHDAPFGEGSFDVVYTRNTLSHLAYPLEEHRRIHQLLRPGGFLVFETGNVADLTPAVAGILELPDHLYHFGEVTIGRLLELAGFRVREMRRFGLLEHLAPVRRIGARLARTRHAGPRPPQRRPVPSQLPRTSLPRRVEGAVGTWLRYGLGRVLSRPGRRSTLVVVAERLPSNARQAS